MHYSIEVSSIRTALSVSICRPRQAGALLKSRSMDSLFSTLFLTLLSCPCGSLQKPYPHLVNLSSSYWVGFLHPPLGRFQISNKIDLYSYALVLSLQGGYYDADLFSAIIYAIQ